MINDLTAVIIGVVCGVLASIPTSLLILTLTGGTRQARRDPPNIIVMPPQRRQLAPNVDHQVIIYEATDHEQPNGGNHDNS